MRPPADGLPGYDADQPTDPAAWLACAPTDKLRLVVAFHARQRLPSGGLKSHAALHLVLEDRVARGEGPVVRALARLQQQGMARHDALHAMGDVLGSHLRLKDEALGTADAAGWQRRLNEALEQLPTPAARA